MGCIYNRGTKSKPRYYIKWKEAGAWRVKKIGPDRSVADAVLKKIESDVVLGRVGLLDETAPDAPIFDAAMMKWAERRRETHRSGFYDWCRAKNHFAGAFDRKRVTQINVSDLVRYFSRKLEEGLAPSTVGLHRRQLSRFFNDLIEEGVMKENPLQRLSRATKRRTTSTHDPRQVPFLRHIEVRNVFLNLPEIAPLKPYRVMFVVGALAGLRPGEIFALEWKRDVDLERRRIHVQLQVQNGRLTPLKDTDSRSVPINDTLLELLQRWRGTTAGEGLLFPADPTRGGNRDRRPTYRRPHTIHKHLRRALKAAGLPVSMTWYQCTRHTYASLWVLDGRPIEKLREILGHSSVKVTERYAHLSPESFNAADYAAVCVDLQTPSGASPGLKVVETR